MTNAADLYGRIWNNPAYRAFAPGEAHALRFLEIAKPDSRIIDFGAGTGRGAELIEAISGHPVTAIDAAHNCLDADVKVDAFIVHDLREPITLRAHYGFCTDVMEHISPSDVDRVLINILEAADKVYFAISTVPDHFGPALIGEPLHLTVQPHSWWRAKLQDELKCRILWEQEDESVACFLVSGWLKASDIEERSELNCEAALIEENIRRNLRLGLQEVAPHKAQDQTIIVLAGGPSLADFEDEIYEQAAAGIPVVTVNAAYGWALDRGILPAAQVMLDGRAFNRRFVERVIPTCKYLMSSQAHHETVAALPRDQVWLWNSAESEVVKRVRDEIVDETGNFVEWYPVPGGTTVMLRALPLLAMLGFRKFSVYGWDSCLRENVHHAYAQPENDGGRIFDVTVGEQIFACHGWMAVQANEFPRVVRYILGRVDGLEIEIHGDGLMSAILKYSASMAQKEH